MFIILEGPDGAGKSTLAQELAKAVDEVINNKDVKIIHKGPPTGATLLDEYMLPIQHHVPGVDHVICDRWHIGEMVYPFMLNRKSLAHDTASWWYLEKFLKSRGALVVYVDASYETLIERLHERGAETSDYEFEISGQKLHFDKALRHTILPVISGNRSIDDVIKWAMSLDADYAHIAKFPTYVGPKRPDYLLLGDVRGTGKNLQQRHRDSPGAFTPHGTSSGRYLMEALQSSYIRLLNVGLVNINEVETDIFGVQTLFETLGYPAHVATLGVNATQRAKRLSIFAGSAPHPQFMQRFYHHHQNQYAQVVWRALRGEDLLKWRP